MKDFIIISIGVTSMLGLLLFGISLLARAECLNAYENYQPQWGILHRCRIMVDGKLTPVDIVRELK